MCHSDFQLAGGAVDWLWITGVWQGGDSRGQPLSWREGLWLWSGSPFPILSQVSVVVGKRLERWVDAHVGEVPVISQQAGVVLHPVPVSLLFLS